MPNEFSLIDGLQIVDGVEVPFRTYGFASAAGGIGHEALDEAVFERSIIARKIQRRRKPGWRGAGDR